MANVMGLDPSLEATGMVVLGSGGEILVRTAIKTKAK